MYFDILRAPENQRYKFSSENLDYIGIKPPIITPKITPYKSKNKCLNETDSF
jgi:hypothetical protein